MIEVFGDLWEYKADAKVITTNGFIKNNGECVMGRGCAFEAKQRYPGIALLLGTKIKEYGNHVIRLQANLFSFPVKHNWWEVADSSLIERSANELLEFADYYPEIASFVLPRPGCGNGQLRWEDVKPILGPILDNRFYVITNEATE